MDWQGTIRAVVANSASGDVVQGASTLTQQYVKNYFLYVAAKTETERLKATEQTPARKLKEAQIALQMERTLSKEEILTRYLNIVSFGNGAARRRGGGAHLLQHHRRQADGGPGRVAGGHGAQHRRHRPGHQAAGRAGAAQRGHRPDARPADDRRRRRPRRRWTSPLGIANPLVTQPHGCIGAGDAGFFCKYAQSYLLDAGFTNDQLNRGGYTIKTTLDPNVLAKVKASLNQQVPAGRSRTWPT